MDPVAFKADVDAIFAILEATIPGGAGVLAFLNNLIDAEASVLAPLVPSGATVTTFLQTTFDALNTKLAGHPFILIAAKALESMALGLIPGATAGLAAKGFKV